MYPYQYHLVFLCPEAHNILIIGSGILTVLLLISLVLLSIAIKIPRTVSFSLTPEQAQHSILLQAQMITEQMWDEHSEKDEMFYINI